MNDILGAPIAIGTSKSAIIAILVPYAGLHAA